MKKILLLCLLIITLSGCKKEEVKEVLIDVPLTKEYQIYYQQDRKAIEASDQLIYGKSNKEHARKYIIDQNDSIMIEDKIFGNGMINSKRYIIDNEMIYLYIDESCYGCKMDEEILNEFILLTKEEIQQALDQATNIKVVRDDYQVPSGYMDILLQGKSYCLKDSAHFNQEYETTYTYTTQLEEGYEGYISIISANEYHIDQVDDYQEIESHKMLEYLKNS